MSYKLEKTATFYGKVSDAPRDFDFWKKKSPQERLDGLEFIRTQERIGLNSDFKDFINCLNSNNVEYMTVGGFAMAFHGAPRYTGDIDFWINPTKENSEKVILALKQFDFPVENIDDMNHLAASSEESCHAGLDPASNFLDSCLPVQAGLRRNDTDTASGGELYPKRLYFEKKDTVLMIGFPPNRIDILSSVSGLNFDECFKNKETIEYNGIVLNFINLENFKENKRASGRKKDLADLDAIE